MRIGMLHNAYRYRGGEDQVVEDMSDLLSEDGHHVSRHIVRSDESLATLGGKLRAAADAAGGWRRSSADRVRALVQAERLDVVHIHNLMPLLTGSVVDACRSMRVPVIASLHNFRPMCANGSLRRDGKDCHECLTGKTVPGIAHACYRGSRAQSVSWALGARKNRQREVWSHGVRRFLAPSTYVRDLYIEAGFDPDRIALCPHFTADPGPSGSVGTHALFIGRVEEAKGILALMRAWPREIEAPDLVVVGDGPDIEEAKAIQNHNIRLIGPQDRKGVARAIQSAGLVVQPSLVKETFGLTLIEAFAHGRPVVAFDAGGPRDIVVNNHTGIQVPFGDIASMAHSTVGLLESPARMMDMGVAARDRYERQYSPRAARLRLMDEYLSLFVREIRLAA